MPFSHSSIRTPSAKVAKFVVLLFAALFLAGPLQGAPAPQGTDFPLFLYEAGNPPNASNFVPYGWNVLQDYSAGSLSAITPFLQACAANSETGLAYIADGGANHSIGARTEMSQALTQNWIQSVAGNGNLWWNMPEEVHPYSNEVAMLTDYCAWTRQYDPQRRPTYEYYPSYLDINTAKAVSVVDVMGVAAYCNGYSLNHMFVRYRMQAVALAGIQQVGRNVGTNYLAGQKLPICVFDIDTNLADGALATTLLYHDFWSAIASGAKGVGIWSSFYMTAALRAQANVAASQITGSEQLGDVILNGVDASNVGFNITSGTTQTVSYASVSYPSLNVLAKVRNGNLYVIAVNSTDQTITANINSLPTSGSSATVLFQSRSLPVSGASVSDTFPAWGVNIYKLPLDTGTAPATPAGLSGTSPSGCEIDLSWTASTGATTYNIKRSTVNGGPYQTVATAVTGTSYSDSTLASSTPYYYVISAVNIYGESANSAQAAATTQVWTRMNDTTPAIIYGGATTYSANGTNGNIGYT